MRSHMRSHVRYKLACLIIISINDCDYYDNNSDGGRTGNGLPLVT